MGRIARAYSIFRRLGTRKLDRLPRFAPGWLLIAAAGYVALSWALIVAVDVLNLAGLRDAMAEGPIQPPQLWFQLYRNNGPTEWLQWLMLGVAAVLAAAMAGRVSGRRGAALFWGLFSVALMLMLIEDAGDPRHAIADLVGEATGSRGLRFAAELSCFALYAAVPLLGLTLGWPHLRRQGWAWRYLLPGFVLYAIAGLASASSGIGDWYQHAGQAVLDALPAGVIELHRGAERTGPGFWLMDTLFEETLELLAAACFLAACLAAGRATPRRAAHDRPALG